MRLVNVAAIAAISLGLGISAASADEMANASTCLSMQDKVRTALGDNASAQNFDAARKERTFGLEYCNNGFYAKGVEHYARALQLLGVAQR